MSASPFINDGYNFDGVVAAKGPWSAVAFKYRPALADEVYGYLQGNKPTGKAQLDAAVKLLDRHIVSWDIVGTDGNLVVKSADTIRRLPHHVIEILISHVIGYAGGEQAGDDEKN